MFSGVSRKAPLQDQQVASKIPVNAISTKFLKQTTGCCNLERFPSVKAGQPIRPFRKCCASVLRTGSGRTGQTGPPLIVGPSSSHTPAPNARNVFGAILCCGRCTTDDQKTFFSLRKMSGKMTATTSQTCGRYIHKFSTFSSTDCMRSYFL